LKLSIADKLALIYTSAGSIRKTAALAGLSHQQVSRILHNAMEGKSNAYYEAKPDFTAAVDVALEIHADASRAQAKAHGLPFSSTVPVFSERLTMRHLSVRDAYGKELFKGEPEDAFDFVRKNQSSIPGLKLVRLLGDRVGALHTHWLSDKLRSAWLTAMQKTGKYYSASIGSLVNLRIYNSQAEKRAKKKANQGLSPRTVDQFKTAAAFKKEQRQQVENKRVFTPYAPLDKDFPAGLPAASITSTLQARHAPATGEKGTAYADQVLLQLDTRKVKNADNSKARGNSRSAKRGKK
jgi:hypothetical protein